MSVQKLKPNFSLEQERIEILKQLIPEAVSDGKIDWDILKESLGEYLEDEDRDAEHFGLTWAGKREARRLASVPSKGTLVPVSGEGIDEATTGNIFIEGDNLEVLKLLQKSYAGRVKLIYIDPPYNTGNDFIYKDDFSEPLDEYLKKTGQADEDGKLLTSNPKSGGRFHSNWLNMMYPRLRLARNLLRDDGVIFISLDDNEIHNLRLVMNEVFGEESFISTVIWQKVYAPKNTAKHFSEDHDYIVCYLKGIDIGNIKLLPRSEEANARYRNLDNDPRGLWKPSDLTARNYYSDGQYEVTSPIQKKFKPSIGNYWRVKYEKFLELDKDNRIWWGKNGDAMPQSKRFLSDVKQGIVAQTLWKYDEVGHTQDAKKELVEFVHFSNTDNVLDSVKPTKLIKRILQLTTNPTEGDIVLDFFCGSGTTAHAVLKQNNDDGGNRQFICVQIPEPLPAPENKLKAIADIAKERIHAAITKIKQEQQSKPNLNVRSQLDLGFKSYKLDRSNLKIWKDYEGTDVQVIQKELLNYEERLVEGWTEEKVVTELQLLEGFPLDSKIEQALKFDKNQVLCVTSEHIGHRLLICLDPDLDITTIQDVRLLEDEDIFICLDKALTDQEKMMLADGCNVKTI